MTDTENVLEALERREDLTESERSLCATIRRLSSELVKAQADRDACAADARQYQERLARVVEAAKVRREESSAMAASLDQAKAEIAALKANVKRKDGDANESFDREAEAFHKATGMLMPGKNICDPARLNGSAEIASKALASLPAQAKRVMKSHELLVELLSNGPYQNDDGECSFCCFAPNDSEDLDHLIAHKETCLYRRAKEHISALSAHEEGE